MLGQRGRTPNGSDPRIRGRIDSQNVMVRDNNNNIVS
jgi:hypothetical protein